jgi:hypothetical protein
LSSKKETYGDVERLPVDIHLSWFNIWHFFTLSLNDQAASPSSIDNPTKLSSCLIFVSKSDNALYSLYNCNEKTLPFNFLGWPAKRAEEADQLSGLSPIHLLSFLNSHLDLALSVSTMRF